MPIKSPIPDVTFSALDVTSFYFGLAQQRDADGSNGAGDVPLVINDATKEQCSFSDIRQTSAAIAKGLLATGLDVEQRQDRNDRCYTGHVGAMLLRADIRLSAIHFGILLAGGTVAAMDPNQAADILGERLRVIGANSVFVAADLLPLLLSALEQADYQVPKSRIFVLDTSDKQPPIDSECVLFEELVAANSDAQYVPPRQMSEDELTHKIALIVYSSGTTGSAKGAMLTHRNIIAAQVMVAGYIAQKATSVSDDGVPRYARETVLTALPPWHLFGLSVQIYQPLATGCYLVVLPELDPHSYIRAIDHYKVTRLCATPGTLHAVVSSSHRSRESGRVTVDAVAEKSFDIGSVEAIVCGGASIPPAREKQYREFFGNPTLAIGYGSTEAGSVIAGCTFRKPAPGAVGVLYANIIAKVLDADGNETDGYGELHISGPQVMAGYVGKDIPSPIADGFLNVGDYVRIGPDGDVFFRGRVSDIIHTSHGPVSTTDIEDVASDFPAVADCGAIGIGPRGHARPLLFVVLDPGSQCSLDQVANWINARLGFHVECHEIDEVPKNHGGKILRKALLERAR
ncbi:hypothetical protein LPJ56_000819 [Coemansia sp. RSA 2599]|nr:hypothetical protein LPJ75_000441 [Coemansia sp. RSA 2598]KAJ1828859.1 hypothetical protein LPJ56_000819 [Coemansia sp. RSA 2599]